MVSVVALRAFLFHDREIHRGEAVNMAPIEAVVAARQGYITLDRDVRPTYQTRDMVAVEPSVAVTVHAPPIQKRRRGRPRKKPVS